MSRYIEGPVSLSEHIKGDKHIYIFLLARLFRSFKDSTEPKNIIIYTGNDHSNFYRKFLSELDFKEVNKVENENQFLNVSELMVPFFQ